MCLSIPTIPLAYLSVSNLFNHFTHLYTSSMCICVLVYIRICMCVYRYIYIYSYCACSAKSFELMKVPWNPYGTLEGSLTVASISIVMAFMICSSDFHVFSS